MAFEYTPEQAALLGDEAQVRELAGWVIGATDNTYAARLCSELSVRQTSRPSKPNIRTVAEYLADPNVSKAVVARLINSRKFDQSPH